MATDGVKIIDGDTAHDTYWGIMDLYDSGATVETIRNQIPFPQPDYYDDFDYEIYITSFALAFWEIGFITDEIIKEVKIVIDKNACVKIWTEECGVKEGKARQRELDKLWTKINSENVKIRKRKKYKLIENFLYDINDVLSFQLMDKYFYAIVLLNIFQYRGECTYKFGRVLLKSKNIPTLSEIIECSIAGKGYGPDITGIDQRELINITDKFRKVGNLKLMNECKDWWGSLGGASTFEELTREFKYDDYEKKVNYGSLFEIKNSIIS